MASECSCCQRAVDAANAEFEAWARAQGCKFEAGSRPWQCNAQTSTELASFAVHERVCKRKRECDDDGLHGTTAPRHRQDCTITPRISLPPAAIDRYSRQLMVPLMGVVGHKRLASASALIVGCGGLGSTAALYLAGAGIGRLGLCDFDGVEVSNLHRQIIHTEVAAAAGESKVLSARAACLRLNSTATVTTHNARLNATLAADLVPQYDVILDCTDNPGSRFLLSDACVLGQRPLVSGSAIGVEGQLTVLHHDGGPCYRCLHRRPPPPAAAGSCGNAGVIGPVPGVIGCLQAMEAIKLAAGVGDALCGMQCLYDGSDGTFRMMKLRPRDRTCAVCGDAPSITTAVQSGESLRDTVNSCVARAADSRAAHVPSVTVQELEAASTAYAAAGGSRDNALPLLDVRTPAHFAICSLHGAVNVPLRDLGARLDEVRDLVERVKPNALHVICRRGNDSVTATAKLLELDINAVNVRGGLAAWAAHVDKRFPVY